MLISVISSVRTVTVRVYVSLQNAQAALYPVSYSSRSLNAGAKFE